MSNELISKVLDGSLTDDEILCLAIALVVPHSWVRLDPDSLYEDLRCRGLLEIEGSRRDVVVVAGVKRDKVHYEVTDLGRETCQRVPAARVVSLTLSKYSRIVVHFIPRLELEELSEVLVHKERCIRRVAEKRYDELTKRGNCFCKWLKRIWRTSGGVLKWLNGK